MVLQNHNTITARFGSGNMTAGVAGNGGADDRAGAGGGRQRPIIDLLVALVLVPVLILCALQLEKNVHEMSNGSESRWLVFALGIGMLVISVIICGYVTHRMGVCIWTGPIDEAGNPTNRRSRQVTPVDEPRMGDALPPSYESVMKFDNPPPPYDCLVIDVEPAAVVVVVEEQRTGAKDVASAHAAIHI